MTLGIDEIFQAVMDLPDAERRARVAVLCGTDTRRAAAVLSLVSRASAAEPVGDASTWKRKLPCQLGPYTLLEVIGVGAHGVVYRAEHGTLQGQVALKLLDRGPGSGLAEVLREAGAARKIPSENVVAVHGAGELPDGTPFIEMTLCADADPERPGAIRLGTSLRDAVGDDAGGSHLDPRDAAAIIEAVCQGVEAAHGIGIIHGDVKPENVLVTPPRHVRNGAPGGGARRRVMLADFGIATAMPGSSSEDRDDTMPRGTPAYMAPEQWRFRSPPSRATDVYMLGGTLLYAVTGCVPHPDRDLSDLGAIDPPRARTPDHVPRRLAEIIDRALSPDPTKRQSRPAVLAEELRCYRTGEPTPAEARRPWRVAELFVRRNADLVAVGVLAAVALGGGLWFHRQRTDDLARQNAAQGTTIAELNDKTGKEIDRTGKTVDRLATQLPRTDKRLARIGGVLDKTQGATREANEKLDSIPGYLLGVQQHVLDTGSGIQRGMEAGFARIAVEVADLRKAAGEQAEESRQGVEALAARVKEMEMQRARAEAESRRQMEGIEKALAEAREELKSLRTQRHVAVQASGAREPGPSR